MKAIQQINDVEKGVIGAVETLTQVSPNATASEKVNAETRQNEITELKDVAIKSVKLISKTNSVKGYSALLQIYQEVVQALESKHFKQYCKVFKRVQQMLNLTQGLIINQFQFLLVLTCQNI